MISFIYFLLTKIVILFWWFHFEFCRTRHFFKYFVDFIVLILIVSSFATPAYYLATYFLQFYKINKSLIVEEKCWQWLKRKLDKAEYIFM